MHSVFKSNMRRLMGRRQTEICSDGLRNLQLFRVKYQREKKRMIQYLLY